MTKKEREQHIRDIEDSMFFQWLMTLPNREEAGEIAAFVEFRDSCNIIQPSIWGHWQESQKLAEYLDSCQDFDLQVLVYAKLKGFDLSKKRQKNKVEKEVRQHNELRNRIEVIGGMKIIKLGGKDK